MNTNVRTRQHVTTSDGYSATYKDGAWEVISPHTDSVVEWEVGPPDRYLAHKAINRARDAVQVAS